MQINNMVVNNIWTPVLMIVCDSEQTYGPVIEDGDRQYNVTPLRSWQEGGKYHYWFIINSTEIVNQELKQTNETLGKQVSALTMQSMQLSSTVDTLGQQLSALTLQMAKGGTA